MRKLLVAIALLSTVLTGCIDGSSEHGQCVGWMNKEEMSANYTYEMDTSNIVWAIVLGETVVFPLLITGLYLWCPTGEK
jgi:hypothetical protein